MDMKTASPEIRETAVTAYLSGKVAKQQIADVLGYHLSAINRWIRDFTCDERLASLPRGHMKPAFTKEERDELVLLLQAQPDITIREIKIKQGKTCSDSSVHRTIVELGFRYKKNRYEPVNKTVKI